jgi:hypothetical protein
MVKEVGGVSLPINFYLMQRPVRLLGKRSAFLLGPHPIGHFEFLAKLAQALGFNAINSITHNYKDNYVYQWVYGFGSQQGPDEPYSNRNIRNNSLFTVRLDLERFPFVELRLINAREIGSGKFLDVHVLPPLNPNPV